MNSQPYESTWQESQNFIFRLWNPRIRSRDTAFPHDGTVPPWFRESRARRVQSMGASTLWHQNLSIAQRADGKEGERPSVSGASQFSSRFRGDHGFLTSAFVRRPARFVRPLDLPVWVVWHSFFFFLVLSFAPESYDARSIWGGWNRKFGVRCLQLKRARTFEKVATWFCFFV